MTDNVVRSSVGNPFVPGHDAVPAVWAGRSVELSDFTGVVRPRRLAGVYERGRAVLGQPGIGKSVLVNRIAQQATAAGDIVLDTVRVPKDGDPVALLADAITKAIAAHSFADRIAQGVLDAVTTIASLRYGDTSIGLSRRAMAEPSHARAVTDGLIELGRIARSIGRAVVVRLDEVQNAADDPAAMSSLLIAVGDATTATITEHDRAGTAHDVFLPVVVYMTGLPSLVDQAEGDAMARAGVTFGRRFHKAFLGWLDDEDLRVALALFTTTGWITTDGPPVTATADAVERLVDASAGDPFLFQLLGAAAWDADRTDPVISGANVDDAIRVCADEIEDHCERILATLPTGERAVLDATFSLPPDERSPKAVAGALGHDASSAIGAALRRLERRGLIRRDGRTIHVTARIIQRHLHRPA